MSDTLRSPKIKPWHLDRIAIVYIRQSTPQQIIEHKESTSRQYGLVDRAISAPGLNQPGALLDQAGSAIACRQRHGALELQSPAVLADVPGNRRLPPSGQDVRKQLLAFSY